MAESAHLLLFLLLALQVQVQVQSFNLEPRIPLVKRGHSGSYFGYSVAQHQTRSPDGARLDSW